MSDFSPVYQTRQAKRQVQHLRARRLGVIALVFLLFCLASGMSIKAMLDRSLWWGIAAQPGNNGMWNVTWFGSWSAASATKLQASDSIVLADGQHPRSEADINRAETLLYLHNGKEQTLHWPVPLDAWPLSISWLVAGIISFVVGALVFLHATDRTLALRFLLLWSVFALIAALEPGAYFGHPTESIASEELATGQFFPLLVSFLWVLLVPSEGGARHRWGRNLPVLLGSGWGLCALVSNAIHLLPLTKAILAIQVALDTSFILLSSWFLLRTYLSHRRKQVERARILLGGVLLGLLPILLLTLIPVLITGGSGSGPFTGVFVVFLPLSFAYASIKRDLLHLDSMIRRSAHIAIAAVGTIILALFIIQVLLRLPSPLNALIGLSAGAVLLPFTWRGSRWIAEFWLFPQLRSYRRLVAQGGMGSNASQEPTPADLAIQLTDQVRDKIPVQQHHIAVFLLDAPGERFTPLAADFPPFKLDEHLYLALKQSRAPVLVEPRSGDLGGAPQWHLLVPFHYRRLVGVLALSRREDGQDYSETDLQFLRLLVANRAALFEYALLGTDLHDALQQLSRYEQVTSAVVRGTSMLLADPLSPVKQQLADLLSFPPQELDRQALQRMESTIATVDEALLRWKTGVTHLAYTPTSTHQSGDVHELVSQIIQQFDDRLQAGRNVIHNLVKPGVMIQGDAAMIARVLWQLLANALEASGPGKAIDVQGTTERLSLHKLEAFRQQRQLPSQQEIKKQAKLSEDGLSALTWIPVAHVIVRDTGEPIRERDLPFIFDRFSAPEHEPPERPGLPGCWELIVERMRGGMWLESDALNGQTAFHLVLRS